MNDKTDLIRYRRAKARETLRDARVLFENESYSSAVNRIYYALFYFLWHTSQRRCAWINTPPP
ncbi:MAG: HEPN domain-containing protein [Spirochaetes bacterium]|nr:MAG: HEPN domain-containing protein [Spirochaetota bacterium]